MTDATKHPDHQSRGHHPQGPSQLKALLQCRGFENLPGTSEAAEMGTRIHEALEVRDPSHLQSEREIELYDKCVRAEDHLIAEYFGGQPYDRFNELPLTIPLNGGYETWGTGDVLCVSKSGSRALMIDYKTGLMKVDDAEENLQARAYKNGAFERFPGIESLRFIFLAPQIDVINWFDFEVDSVAYDRQIITQIVANSRRVREDWAQGRVDVDDLTVCEHCTWCRHQSYCPAINGLLLDTATAAGIHPPDHLDVNNLDDPNEVAEFYTIAKTLEPLIEKIKQRAVEMAQEGEVLPGWELRSMGAKNLTDDNVAFYAFAQEHGVTLEDLLANVNIPVAKVRDLVKDRAPKGDKGKVAKAFEKEGLDRGVIHKGTERFTLRPETSDD